MTLARFAGVLLLVLPACENDTKIGSEPEGLSIQVVIPEYQSTVATGPFLASSTPVEGATVAVVWNGEVIEQKTDPDGFAVFEQVSVTVTDSADISVADADGDHRLAVMGWAQNRAILPYPDQSSAPAVASCTVTDTVSRVAGVTRGWLPSGFDQRSEANIRWQHVQDLCTSPELASISDLYVRNGIQVGSGAVECICTDPDVQACLKTPGNGVAECPCESEDITCNDPGGFAVGVSAFSFFAPSGPIEIGYVERITDYVENVLIETGGLFYQDDLFVPVDANIDELILEPVTTSSQTMCQSRNPAGDMRIVLDGIGRQYVISARGGLRFGLHLAAPSGLQIPILVPNRNLDQRSEVFSASANRQRLSVAYPFRLDGILAGFSYGYSVRATSSELGTAGRIPYQYSVLRNVRGGIIDPCLIEVPLTTFETEFAKPTTLEPLRATGENAIQWTGPPADLRRLAIVDANGQTQKEVWILDRNRTVVDMRSGTIGAFWGFASGDYVLRYDVIESNAAIGPDFLILGRTATYESDGSYFRQEHAFTVE